MEKLIVGKDIAAAIPFKGYTLVDHIIRKKTRDDPHIRYFLDVHEGKIPDKKMPHKVEPDETVSHIISGFIKEENGDNRGAIEEFNKAIDLAEHNIMAYLGRGITYVNMFKFEHALVDLNKVINFGSRSVFPYLYRGYARYYLGETYSAIEDYDTALGVISDPSGICNNIGIIFAYLKEHIPALEYYNLELGMNPNDFQARQNRSEIEFFLGHYEVALEDSDFVLNTEGENIKYKIKCHYIRGACNLILDKKEKYQQAVDDMTTVIKYEPDNTDAYSLRGLIKYELLGAEEAKKDFLAALNIYRYQNIATLAMERLGHPVN